MKNKQKLLLGLAFLAFPVLFTVTSPQKAFAAAISSQEQIESGLSTLEFKNRATIEGTFAGQKIKFIDENPYDTGKNDYNYKPEDGYFCSTGETISGITIQNGGIAPDKFGKVGNSVLAHVDLDYNTNESLNDQNCFDTEKDGEGYLRAGVRTNGLAFASLGWEGGKLVEVSSGDSFIQLSQKAKNFYVTSRSGECFGDRVVALENDNQGVIFSLGSNPGGTAGKGGSRARDASKDSLLKEYFSKSGKCHIHSEFKTSILGPRGTSDSPGGGGDEVSSCESSVPVLGWIACPALDVLDGMFKGINALIVSRLTFCTGGSDTAGDYCDNDESLLTAEVRQAWSIFRVLATSVLVIIMLIMVFSQAINAGIFDAYTVRKLLPRLVVAAIIIQLSWYIFKWFIDLSNDLGHGIANLMFIPFGGQERMQLEVLIDRVGAGAEYLTTAALFTGLIGTFAFGALTVGGVFLLALSVVASIIVALLVLLFREILLILAMILVPVALVLWILPGTQRYWKLWQENFTKLLLMFPLIMALIAAGKIFAYIGASTSDYLLAIIIVFVGYFGPYFILPKTFNWGGQLFATLANATWNGTKRYRAYPGKYALEGAKANREQKALQRATRIGRDPLAASRWDKLLAGGYNVALKRGSTRDARFAKTIAEGQDAARKEVSQELTIKGYQNWAHETKLDALETWLRGGTYEGISAEGNDELRLFAFKTLADLGDTDRIRKARQQGKLRGSVWLKGRAENIGALNAKASDMGISPDLSTVAPEAMTQWKSHTFKEWMRQLQNGVVMDNSDEGGGDIHLSPEERERQLQLGIEQARRLMSNQLNFDRLSSDQQEFVRQMATRSGTLTHVNPRTGDVLLPEGETVNLRPSVRQDIMQKLSDSSQGGHVARGVAPHIISAAKAQEAGQVLSPDQEGYMQLYRQVQNRATAVDATPEMKRAFDNLRRSVTDSLQSEEAEVERRFTAANDPHLQRVLTDLRNENTVIRSNLGI